MQNTILAPNSLSDALTFLQVKVKNWVNGTEGTTVVGLSARFGASLPKDIHEATKTFAVLANPFDCCSNLTSKLANSVALATRGECAFTAKAKNAQAAGAAGLLVINDNEELYKMVCSENDTSIDVTIPVVMIPQSAGKKLREYLDHGANVEVQLYAPNRPVVDLSACFLWIMAVGTIVCASLWTEFVAMEHVDEHYNQLTRKDGPNSGTNQREDKEIFEISAKGAIVFIIVASVFLLLLFYFMSSWFVWVLIVLFCIGGIEGMHACLVTLFSRIFKDCGHRTVQLPLLGEVLSLSVGILPFCVVFAVLWAVYRHASFAWIGQDILVRCLPPLLCYSFSHGLGICLMITVLQMARLPNIRVASALLSAAFVYDIFWVFISPLLFHESVMIAVASEVFGVSRGGKQEAKDTWWWNDEVQRAIKEKECLKRLHLNKSAANIEGYKIAKRAAKRAVSIAKGQAYDNLYQRLGTKEGEKDIYRLARICERKTRDINQINVSRTG
ncbi:hypothetical protein PR202_gb29314 [Eleusine coracana subsp. coracana]|uniref:PA domain-containing protein n=1 Tax=Eleusine coracana subsp. coracana TaxID=191504 RepID=A0AAV5FWR5_ELECO|nr:hypothetical protein PR202_gb29314 [Eleusine coracana subsp. coracana]